MVPSSKKVLAVLYGRQSCAVAGRGAGRFFPFCCCSSNSSKRIMFEFNENRTLEFGFVIVDRGEKKWCEAIWKTTSLYKEKVIKNGLKN